MASIDRWQPSWTREEVTMYECSLGWHLYVVPLHISGLQDMCTVH